MRSLDIPDPDIHTEVVADVVDSTILSVAQKTVLTYSITNTVVGGLTDHIKYDSACGDQVKRSESVCDMYNSDVHVCSEMLQWVIHLLCTHSLCVVVVDNGQSQLCLAQTHYILLEFAATRRYTARIVRKHNSKTNVHQE